MNPEDKEHLQRFIDSVNKDVADQEEASQQAAQAKAMKEAEENIITRKEWLYSYPKDNNATGRLVIEDGKVYEIVGVSRPEKVYGEDVSSLGGPIGHDEDMYTRVLKLKPNDSERAQQMLKEDADSRSAEQARMQSQIERNKIADEIKKTGELPPAGSVAEGQEVGSTRSIYGGGDWFVIGPEYIWYVMNNSMDGDYWAASNLNGAIGWRVPYSRELSDRIMAMAGVKDDPEKIIARLLKVDDLKKAIAVMNQAAGRYKMGNAISKEEKAAYEKAQYSIYQAQMTLEKAWYHSKGLQRLRMSSLHKGEVISWEKVLELEDL